jgi:hypothetical protein
MKYILNNTLSLFGVEYAPFEKKVVVNVTQYLYLVEVDKHCFSIVCTVANQKIIVTVIKKERYISLNEFEGYTLKEHHEDICFRKVFNNTEVDSLDTVLEKSIRFHLNKQLLMKEKILKIIQDNDNDIDCFLETMRLFGWVEGKKTRELILSDLKNLGK